ncbi:MAG: histidine kinase, partial [Caldimonas sp.]
MASNGDSSEIRCPIRVPGLRLPVPDHRRASGPPPRISMELPRFRRDDSWIESLGRDVALAVTLVAMLVVMERLNDWIAESVGPERIWRQFWNYFRIQVVGQLTAVFVVFAGRRALPEAGVWRWLGLAALLAVACVLGWQALAQWQAIGWPHWPPLHPFVARTFQHQLAVTALLMAGLHEFLRISRSAEGALHHAQLRRIAIEGDLAEGRMQVLQAQIEPHFLFNSLANLRRLMRIDSLSGQAM